jgi:hypothetical protein
VGCSSAISSGRINGQCQRRRDRAERPEDDTLSGMGFVAVVRVAEAAGWTHKAGLN